MASESDFNSITELQWAHSTLMRLISLVQLNALIGDNQRECVVSMTRSAVMLEGLIQEHLAMARRLRFDAEGN